MKIKKIKINRSLTSIFLVSIILILPFNSISGLNLIKQTRKEKQLDLVKLNTIYNEDIAHKKKATIPNKNLLILTSIIERIKQSFGYNKEIKSLCNKALKGFKILPDAICIIIFFFIYPIVIILYELSYHPNYFVSYYARIMVLIIVIIFEILCDFPYYYIHSKSASNDSIFSDIVVSSNLDQCPCLLE